MDDKIVGALFLVFIGSMAISLVANYICAHFGISPMVGTGLSVVAILSAGAVKYMVSNGVTK